MEVKMANVMEEKINSKSRKHIQERVCSTQSSDHSSFEEEVQDNADILEMLSGVNSCLTAEKNQPICEEASTTSREDFSHPSHTTMDPLFCFSPKPEIKTRRRRFDVKTHGSSQIKSRNSKRRKVSTNKKVPYFFT